MLRGLTIQQFLDWAAYAEVEQFGEARADSRAANIVRTLWNVNRDIKKRREPYAIGHAMYDFLKELGELTTKKSVQTWQEKKDLLKMALLGSKKRG